MKKLLLVCTTFTFISIFFLLSLSIYRSLQGDNTTVYTRFYAADSTGTHFNWLGLLSPVQTENQKIVTDTMRFTHKVVYPYGKNFQCVTPNDTTTESFVASEIARVIQDSVDKISFNTKFDYDGKSLAVRESAKPMNRQLAKPIVELKLFGTASPEARKYGFEQSVMPGMYEPENDTLARNRLERTATILEQKGFTASSTSYAELQFSDTASAMMAIQNPAILDSLRWVEASVTIPIERLEVTPATAPVLFPFWLWLSVLGMIFLYNLRLPKLQRPKIEWGEWGWGGIWYFLKLLGICLLTAIAFTVLVYLFGLNWFRWLLWLILLIFILGTIHDIWLYRQKIWGFLKRVWIGLFLLIGKYFVAVWDWLDKKFAQLAKWFRRMQRRLATCWACLTPCWKRVFILVTVYAIAMTVLVIYLI